MTPRGRPKLDEPRDKPIVIRLTETEHKLVDEAAKKSGESISNLGRDAILRTAKRKLK